MTLSKPPVIVLAFANNDGRSLRQLDEEQRALLRIFQPLQERGHCEVVLLPAATSQDVVEAFASYRERICLFHYGGHSDRDEIFLKDSYSDQSGIQAENLAQFFALQQGLAFVFLNSCLSLPQARLYHRAGVKAVLATSTVIEDTQARRFAQLFYTVLTVGADIQSAYREAEAGLQVKDENGALRGIPLEDASHSFCWQLFPEGKVTWRLPMLPRQLTRIPAINLDKEFIGREQDLLRLRDKLVNATRPIVIRGVGGIGKTVLATAYLEQFGDQYDHLIWINHGEDLISAVALNESLIEKLNASFEKDDNLEVRFRQIMGKLHDLQGSNLLVIDDASGQIAEKRIAPFLPGRPHWQVLVTSRQGLNGFDDLLLEQLDATAARELFLTFYQQSYNEEELTALLEEIGYHTLTIELLGRLLAKLNYTRPIAELTDILRQRRIDDLQQKIWLRYSGEDHTVYSHLLEAFRIIEDHFNKMELWLLRQFSMLPSEQFQIAVLQELFRPQVRLSHFLEQRQDESFASIILRSSVDSALRIKIPRGFLLFMFEKLGLLGKEQINQEYLVIHLNQLVTKGWLSLDENNTYSMHKLIQQVLIYQLEPSLQDADILLDTITTQINYDNLKDMPTSLDLWLNYAMHVERFFDREESRQLASLRNNISGVLSDLGQYKLALAYQEKTLRDNGKTLRRKDTKATYYNNLAGMYLDNGDYRHALLYMKKALRIRNRSSKKRALDLSSTYNNISTVYRYLDQIEKAIHYQQKAIHIQEAILDNQDPILASSYNNMSDNYLYNGQYREALFYAEQSLAIRKAVLDNDHPKLAMSYSGVGKCFLKFGAYEKALPYFRKTLKIREKILDPNHPELAGTYCDLGNVYHELGQQKEALAYMKKYVKIVENAYDDQHPRLATTYFNAGVFYSNIGQLNKSLPYLQKALSIRESILDPWHKEIADSYNSMSAFYYKKKSYEKALSYQRKVIASYEQSLSPQHPELARAYANIGRILRDMQQYEEAIDYERRSLRIRERIFDPKHPERIESMRNLEELQRKRR